jgi:hypothetical protein
MAGAAIDLKQFDGLDEFCTVRQLEYLSALRDKGSYYGAAKECGVALNVVRQSMKLLLAKAAKQSVAAHQDVAVVPDGFGIKGTSTLVKDGKVALQWVKTDRDHERQEQLLREFAQNLAEGVKGLAPVTPPPSHAHDDLLCVVPMGDPHFGMYAWAADAGADFDLNIAEQLTCAAIDRLVASGPAAGTALLLNLGDMFHADNQRNQTNSGHQLDVDGRWAKVQKVGLLAMIHCIRRLLEKYPRVVFRINKGNHDGHSSYALALMLSCYFHNEPRVEVDLSPAVAWYYRFGKVLIGSTHGDTIKGKDMLAVMAADKPEEWGQTKHRHWYVGHVHHHDSKEYHGGTVEYFRTLASRDAWHQGQGYRAGRDMCMIVHHREHGEIERHRCDVGMLA